MISGDPAAIRALYTEAEVTLDLWQVAELHEDGMRARRLSQYSDEAEARADFARTHQAWQGLSQSQGSGQASR